jgi:hypothetical protein
MLILSQENRQLRSEKVHAYEHRYSKCGPEGMAQNLAVNRNLCYSFGMVGSQSRFQPGDGERAIQSRFLQPDARMANPGKGSQEFFIPIGCNPLKSPVWKK